MYSRGNGVAINFKEAVRWTRKAAEQDRWWAVQPWGVVSRWPRRGEEFQGSGKGFRKLLNKDF